MKFEYLNPELKIVSFENEDIITTSSLFDNLLDEMDTNNNNIIDGSEW